MEQDKIRKVKKKIKENEILWNLFETASCLQLLFSSRKGDFLKVSPIIKNPVIFFSNLNQKPNVILATMIIGASTNMVVFLCKKKFI